MNEKKEPTVRDLIKELNRYYAVEDKIVVGMFRDFLQEFDKEHNPEPEKLIAGEVYEDSQGNRYFCTLDVDTGELELTDKHGSCCPSMVGVEKLKLSK